MTVNKMIDNHISIARKVISICSDTFQNFNDQIVNFLSLKNINAYNSLIDSLYLLEDTQLAKDNYYKFDITGPTKIVDFGEIYLRLYGILNACYLQKQALFICCNVLGLTIDKNVVHALPIFEYRKIFAAHTSNVGDNDKIHSYILGRHSLLEGNVKGYSLNSPNGESFKEAKLGNLIAEWDRVLLENISKVNSAILQYKTSIPELNTHLDKVIEVFELVKDIQSGKCFCSDIWAERPIVIDIAQTTNAIENSKSAPQNDRPVKKQPH